jgi:hypothetical protein
MRMTELTRKTLALGIVLMAIATALGCEEQPPVRAPYALGLQAEELPSCKEARRNQRSAPPSPGSHAADPHSRGAASFLEATGATPPESPPTSCLDP